MKLSYTRKYASQVENTLTLALISSAFCANTVEKTVGIERVFRRMKLRPVSNGLRSVEKKRWKFRYRFNANSYLFCGRPNIVAETLSIASKKVEKSILS